MYRVEVYEHEQHDDGEEIRLVDVLLYESLENAIYEGTHTDKEPFYKVTCGTCNKITHNRPTANILNDEFVFIWENAATVRIKKAVAKDKGPSGTSSFLYAGRDLTDHINEEDQKNDMV